MDIKTLQLLSKYNEETNKKMNTVLETLNKEQWKRAFGGFFSSIRILCNHIYICDFNWLKRFSKLRDFDYIKKDLFHKEMKFTESAFVTIGDYIDKRTELDLEIDEFVKEVTREDLSKKLTYTDSHGNEYSKNFGGLVLHMFNHETHHRGMISIYLEEMGIENDYSNLMEIL